VRARTVEDLRGLIIELVAVDASGKDQLSSLEQPEVQKLKSIFSHQNLDLTDIVTKVRVVQRRGRRVNHATGGSIQGSSACAHLH
jgi:hypothetical protein